MKAQAVKFQRIVKSEWEVGIAIVEQLGVSDIIAIVDKNGNFVKKIWNYKLMSTPLSYIDTDY
jgi:hypothetical protein